MITFKLFNKKFNHEVSATNPLTYILVPLFVIWGIILFSLTIIFLIVAIPVGILIETIFPTLKGKLVHISR